MMKRLVSGVAVVALMLGGMAYIGVFGAGAASTPTITITPNTGLANTQSVQVTGTGFTPNQGLGTMAAVECVATATTTAGCDTAHYVLVTSDASGNVNFAFAVETGTVGNGTCGTSATDATCLISVGSVSPPATLAAATITFATGGSTTTTTTTIPTTTTTTASSPSVQVSPSTGLSKGESVTVTGTGFKAADSVFAVECLATATTSAGCDTATATPITVGADGTLPSTTFKVVTGTVGTGTCGTSSANRSNCIIEVANPTATDVGFAPITFKTPSVTAPKATKISGPAIPGKTVTLTISGTNFTAGAKITGHAGTTFSVTKTTATKLTVKVTEAATGQKGTYTLSIHFASDKYSRLKYTVK
jgi:hypothetical protein